MGKLELRCVFVAFESWLGPRFAQNNEYCGVFGEILMVTQKIF